MKFSFHNSLRALFLSLAVLLSLPMLAVEVEIDEINYELVSKLKQATVIKKSSGEYSGEVVIPESVEYDGIAYVVTSIGDDAFEYCSGLTSVTIPNSVTSIGYEAFCRCSGLTSVTIPNSVMNIEYGAFWDCSGLTSVTIGNSVTSIGYYAFADCSGLTSVTIPNSVTSIGFGAFDGCSGLTSVTIPNSVTSIGGEAFSRCHGLTSIVVKDGNPVYDSRNNCNAIIETATNTLHSGCKTTIIPNSVTSIWDYAFYGCSGLTSVSIPNSVTSIGDWAFRECSGLTSVTIPNSVTSIGDYAFYNCFGLTSVTIPNSVTSIGREAFEFCSGLTSVTIPNSVTNIGGEAFSGCFGLTSIVVEDGNPVYDSRNNCNAIIETATSTLHFGCKTTIIPNSVTSIGDYAFWVCYGLTSVTIPNSVTSIGVEAFYQCTGLTSVTIPNSVTSIGDYAFSGCSGLTSVTIPNSVTSIGNSAFSGCSGLTSVTIPNSVTSIGDYAFSGCSGLTSVTIPNSVTSIGYGAFNNCSGLTSVTIPNSVKSIGYYAFEYCSGLTSVTIPNSVTSIGDGTFYYCKGLTSVTIPNSVTSIGERAFWGCPELHDVYCYAEKVPSTESNAFDGSYPENATLHVPAASMNSYKATAPWSSFGKIVAISESTSDLVIKDGESFENTEERELGTLTYTRTLPNMLWNPLYVPFKIPYEALKDNYDVAYINSMHSYDNDQNGEIDKMTMEVILVKNGVLKANHPYLIRAKSDNDTKMELVLEDVTLYPTVSNKLDCSSVYTRFEITGTYKKMTRADLNGSLVITTSGAWMELSESSELKPFRFYLTITDRPGSPLEVSKESKSRINICVQGEDDFSTGIEETENGKVKSENSAVYDLSGRRVQKAQKGIYIQNGKVVVK